jgi:hypothetical protein
MDFEFPKGHSKTGTIPALDPPNFDASVVDGNSSERGIKSRRGMADSQSHPFCSLLLHSETTLDTFDTTFDRPVSTVRACKFSVKFIL